MMDEQRERMRQILKKLAFAKNDKGARGGLLKDISAHGAGMDFVNPTGIVDHDFEVEDSIEIMIDGFDPLNGRIVRIHDEGISVAFDLDSADEKALIASIMAAANDIDVEPETAS